MGEDIIGRQGELNRIWELDFLRGIALILMVIFHILYDLREFYSYPVEYHKGIYFYIGRVSAILFMLLAGVSSVLSRNNIGRGLQILLYALLITVVTHLWDPIFGIKFGILHFMGVSILLYQLIKGFPGIVLFALSMVLLYLGTIFPTVSVGFLFPIGLTSSDFASADYYPLIPWFGVFLIGALLGRSFYKEKRSLLPFRVSPNNPIIVIGSRTLPLYLVHQPLILLILYLLLK